MREPSASGKPKKLAVRDRIERQVTIYSCEQLVEARRRFEPNEPRACHSGPARRTSPRNPLREEPCRIASSDAGSKFPFCSAPKSCRGSGPPPIFGKNLEDVRRSDGEAYDEDGVHDVQQQRRFQSPSSSRWPGKPVPTSVGRFRMKPDRVAHEATLRRDGSSTVANRGGSSVANMRAIGPETAAAGEDG